MKIALLFCLLPAVLGVDLTPLSLAVVRQSYDSFDTNGNGVVQLSDLKYFFTREDANGDGYITFQEYSDARPSETPQENLHRLFQYYDKLDGSLDGKVSVSVVLVIYKRMDTNNDDQVSFNEFSSTMTRINHDVASDVLISMANK
ncbi:probable calcium-binding mitochondrial carrier CBG00135 [Pomacea canaliculata]|uniref:probable calcium-binding mitochondrial carrier CBG00135 n=1 Tax=Pomacea canaliculata TaxID=400727 RepID=UPI000D7286C2|nr:probable calcium-binding mitochondrial carrier CBG00135 [Pomacea canaliculata]